MEFFVVWIVLACIVGAIATDKVMGFWGGFLWSFLLSPVIGFIIVLFGKTLATQKQEDMARQAQFQQTQILHNIQQQQNSTNQMATRNISDELDRLKHQLDKGIITEEEFTHLKKKLIS